MRPWLLMVAACGAPVASSSVTIPTHVDAAPTGNPDGVVVVPNADPRACAPGERGAGTKLAVVAHGPQDASVNAGQMTEEAARAKRLFDSEKWTESERALARVVSGDSGDDDGNRQLAQYHLAIAQYRSREYDHALDTLAEITKDSLHLKWNESILWAVKLVETDFSRRADALDLVAVTGAPFCRGEKDSFNNPNQRDLRSKVFYYAGRGALRAGNEALAKQCFSRLPTTDSFHALAAACLVTK